MVRDAQLECRVGQGIFPHERAVHLEGVEGAYSSWADADQVLLPDGEGDVEAGNARGFIRVLVVEVDGPGARALVQLPREVVMGGRRVWVPTGSLR